jgi:outer membrane lipase/esterase
MISSPARRWFSAALLTSCFATLLTACGSGSTFEPLQPSRFIVFGDSMADVGQAGATARFTVNDSSTNIWALQTAARYGLGITPSSAGGLGYASAGARVNSGANSIAAQISSFLAAGALGKSDVVLIDAGITEITSLVNERRTNAIASDAALNTAAQSAGVAFADQVRRLVAAGGKHIVIANSYDLGRAPYAAATGSAGIAAGAVTAAVRSFNDSLKISLASQTDNVLLVDTEGYYNPIIITPSTNLGAGAVSNAAVCTTAVANACTPSTLIAGVSNYNLYFFADDRHLTPAVNVLFGNFAYDKIKQRW